MNSPASDPRPTTSQPDDDPYLWLEDVHGERALAWVERQNAGTVNRMVGDAFDRDRDALAAIFDRDDKLPYIWRLDGKVYNFWKDARNVHGLWRRTTLASYTSDAPEWETVLNLDRLRKAENEDWVYSGATMAEDGSGLCMVRLSHGGGDAVVIREFDVNTAAFIEGGFELEEAKGGIAWLDRDTLLVASTLDPGSTTKSGYARTVRLWRRGTKLADAKIVFETDANNMAVWAQVDHTTSPPTPWILEQLDFQNQNCWVGDPECYFRKIDLPTSLRYSANGDLLALSNRDEWTVDGITHPAGSVLVTSVRDVFSGNADYQVLFAPKGRRVRRYMFWSNGKLIIGILDNLEQVIEVHQRKGGVWKATKLDGIPKLGAVSVARLDLRDEANNDDLLINCETPVSPAQLLLSKDGRSPQLLKSAPEVFDASGLTVTRHEAIAEDGTAIPYFQTGPKQTDGNPPVHMYGYGGFEVSELPTYRSTIGKLWLERGGVSVVACIRGGGEFGPDWHKAGIREHKRNSHDDFATVAAHLVERGVTRPERIAAEGGSNGGILITNMLTRHPERFGALFCTIPLIDMRRYSKLLAGASWIAEYGDPDKPEDWAFLKEISAYHTAKPGQNYPPIMLATTQLDDRVHPGHARKMAAKLQALGYDAAYYEAATGGHSYGKDSKEQATFTALGIEFLKRGIGWSD